MTATDITGQVFGFLRAIERCGTNDLGLAVWRFECGCGRTVERAGANVRSARRQGLASNCGCIMSGPSSHKSNDLQGQRFGKLLVIEWTGERKAGQLVWRCGCECGRETTVRGPLLLSGQVKTCGCGQAPEGRFSRTPVDVQPGMRFGRLVVGRDAKPQKGRRWVWCKCDCGERKAVRANQLAAGQTKSCGCLKRWPKMAMEMRA